MALKNDVGKVSRYYVNPKLRELFEARISSAQKAWKATVGVNFSVV